MVSAIYCEAMSLEVVYTRNFDGGCCYNVVGTISNIFRLAVLINTPFKCLFSTTSIVALNSPLNSNNNGLLFSIKYSALLISIDYFSICPYA